MVVAAAPPRIEAEKPTMSIVGLSKLLSRQLEEASNLTLLRFSDIDPQQPSSPQPTKRQAPKTAVASHDSASSIDEEATRKPALKRLMAKGALGRAREKKKSGNKLVPAPIQALWDAVPPRIRGLAMLNLLVVLVGTNWVVVKDAGNNFDPFLFAALRFGTAAVALAPFLLRVRPTTLRAGVELGIYTAAGYLAQSEGLLTTDASRASFLSTFTVLVVPFLAGMSGRGVKPITWFAALAALVGVSMLEQSGSPPCMGDVWSAISAIAFGIQIFRTEHWSRIIGRRHFMSLTAVVLATTAGLSAVAAGGSHITEITQFFQTPLETTHAIMAANIPWGEVIYTGIFTTDLVLLMELIALRDVTSTEAAIIYTLEPVLGAGFAFALLGERWGPLGWVGAALIVTSCLGMQIFGGEEVVPAIDSESD